MSSPDPTHQTHTRVEEAIKAVSTQATNSQENPLAGFGPNEWIVEDMYQRYLADPSTVDPAWHDFFADYKPAAEEVRLAEPKPAEPAAAEPEAVPPKRDQRVEATGVALTEEPVSTESSGRRGKGDASDGRPSRASGANASNTVPLRGVAARIVANMEASLEVPTATSVRAVPAKLLAD